MSKGSYWLVCGALVTAIFGGCADGEGADNTPSVVIDEDTGVSDANVSDANDAATDTELECDLECDDGDACTVGRTVVEGDDCESARCEYDPIASCGNDDGCCPAGCNANSDNDCSAECGNGVVESGEACDGDCPRSPADCRSQDSCAVASVVGNADDCSAECIYDPKTECQDGDGCCPSNCTLDADSDCRGDCGPPLVETIDTGRIHDTILLTRGGVHAVYVREKDGAWSINHAIRRVSGWEVTTVAALEHAPQSARLGGMAYSSGSDIHIVYSAATSTGEQRIYHATRWAHRSRPWEVNDTGWQGRVFPRGLALREDLYLRVAFQQEDKLYLGRKSSNRYSRRNLGDTMADVDDLSLQLFPDATPWILFSQGGSLYQIHQESLQFQQTLIAEAGRNANGELIEFGSLDITAPEYEMRFVYSVTRTEPEPVVTQLVTEHYDGSQWVSEFVSGADDIAQGSRYSRSAVAKDDDGGTYISWGEVSDGGDGRLVYATDDQGRWHRGFVADDAVTDTHSMAVTSTGAAFLAYGSSTSSADTLEVVTMCPDAQCTPDCSDRECGPDGCGGSCGDCGSVDCRGNSCECIPDCSGKLCGDDGCGGSCGICAPNEVCNAQDECECVPDCSARSCGDDGCGGSCGTCGGTDEVCTATGQCCVPDCGGKTCGTDGCGGSCGSCPSGEICNSQNQCEQAPCDPVAQSGCASAEKCTFDGNDFICLPDGHASRGQVCGAGDCNAGNICINTGSSQTCRQFCNYDYQCPSGGKCALSLSGTTVGLCTNPCDPFTSGSCPNSQTCHVANFTGANEATDCREWGSTFKGGSCSSPDDCWMNLTCVAGHCRELCQPATSCTNGMCQQVSGWVQHGVCPL